MFLEQNVAVLPFTEIRNVLELAFRHQLAKGRGAAIVFKYLRSVQPMLDMIAADDDSCSVPFANRVWLFVLGCGHQIVKRTERSIAIAAKLGIGVTFIIQDLIFQANRR